ncbi:MAG: glycoside hydrolase family 3 C-terminal domain-containing protein [Spirochaetales bacterium]|nr:glycoside hydrolase family 3 C-terminal domain-containing protein [Spirochaetales bacterium]
MNIKEILGKLTIEEKASLCSGRNFWLSNEIPRLGIPSLRMNDGPHGMRVLKDQSHLWVHGTVKAICFPTASALAASWNRDLVQRVGQALSEEAKALGVNIILGPGMNIKRTPLCGRNFEYFSEDPLVSSEMAGAMVKGIQSKGVAACVKHYACNNQEYQRMTISAEMDERVLHELYLRGFQQVIAKYEPQLVMCSYNKINGTWASENSELLTEILREGFGFKGLVVSDWAAVVNPEKALKAGLDLEMPGTGGVSQKRLLKAYEEGIVTEAEFDRAVTRLLKLIEKTPGDCSASFDEEKHHQLAKEAAGEAIVLLKNKNQLLPLDTKKYKNIAVIGRFAVEPRYQGGGSSHVEALKEENLLDSLKSLAPDCSFSYEPGYSLKDTESPAEIDQAVKAAEKSDFTVLVIGLPDSYEFEGFDRTHMDLPAVHNLLVQKVLEVQKNTAILLVCGSAVSFGPWLDEANAMLLGWLSGQAGAAAMAEVLLGKINPSGKLTETFAHHLDQTPAYLNYPGENGKVHYGEGLYVGYRYYDKKKIIPAFSFGYGLSYTCFEYKELKIGSSVFKPGQSFEVSCVIKNTGPVKGSEVVQLYVGQQDIQRPVKELRGFEKISLEPGEEKRVCFVLNDEAFERYHCQIKGWYVPAGDYSILIGTSSAKILLKGQVKVEAPELDHVFDVQDQLLLLAGHPEAVKALEELTAHESIQRVVPGLTVEMLLPMRDLPLYRLMALSGGLFTPELIETAVKKMNENKKSR